MHINVDIPKLEKCYLSIYLCVHAYIKQTHDYLFMQMYARKVTLQVLICEHITCDMDRIIF